MSRSRKKAIYKDKGMRPYWRLVRGRINQDIRNIVSLNDKDDYHITNPREIVCDYDYSDYTFDCEYKRADSEWREKLTRK